MESIKAANEIKRLHNDKRYRDGNQNQINISNCMTQATKVRIEIFKAIANKHRGEQERFYVSMNEPRPVLKVTNNRTRAEKVMTFTDAVVKYGQEMTTEELKGAYEKAGEGFKGQMTSTFIILKEQNIIAKPAYDPELARQRREEGKARYENRNQRNEQRRREEPRREWERERDRNRSQERTNGRKRRASRSRSGGERNKTQRKH